MTDQMLHTPDGVRDIYNGECRQKLLLQERLHSVLERFGYHDIQTPTFEFFNIFAREIGTTPSKDLYKFFDKDGNTLVLRPDFTPSVARSAAKYYTKEDMPVRLCYMGSTFVNSTAYQGRLRETTQCGAEMIGDGTVAADAEMLAMTVYCLLESGLRDFQISVGHARFFQGLSEAAKLSEEQSAQLRELLVNKNYFGVEEFADGISMDEPLRRLFPLLASFETTREELSRARELAADYPGIGSALLELAQLGDYLQMYGVEKYVSFELGVVSDRRYYTGIIFAGYTFGTGEAVVSGGRYDKLLHFFGKNEPAIGFGIVVDQLLSALSRQKIALPEKEDGRMLFYRREQAADAVARAQKLRREGVCVTLMQMEDGRTRDEYLRYAMKNHVASVVFLEDEQ